MTERKAFDLVVFDWDGTLMDSQSRIVSAMQGAIADLGWPERGHDAISHIIGLGMNEATEALFPGTAPADVLRFRDAYRERFFDEALPPSSLFDGVERMLADLEAAGLLLAVATGKSRRGLDREMERVGLGHRFDATRCADEGFSKPHPDMLERIIERTGTEASRTLMIGDTIYDLQMAANAGTAAVGVTWGVHDRDTLASCDPLRCFDRLDDLSRWLAGDSN